MEKAVDLEVPNKVEYLREIGANKWGLPQYDFDKKGGTL